MEKTSIPYPFLLRVIVHQELLITRVGVVLLFCVFLTLGKEEISMV